MRRLEENFWQNPVLKSPRGANWGNDPDGTEIRRLGCVKNEVMTNELFKSIHISIPVIFLGLQAFFTAGF
jgi:hypothetical protein